MSKKKPKFHTKEEIEEIADGLPDRFVNGESVIEVCADLGIGRATFYRWLQDYPYFAEQYELGKTFSEAWWVRQGRKTCQGDGDVKVSEKIWYSNMKNRFGWRDRTDMELSGKDGGPIQSEQKVTWEILPVTPIDKADDDQKAED